MIERTVQLPDAWRIASAEFTNPRHNRLHLTTAKVLRPSGMVLAPLQPGQGFTLDIEKAARVVPLDWIAVAATVDGLGVSSSRLLIGPKASPAAQLATHSEGQRATEFAIEFRGFEISAKPRKIRIVATTITKD